MKFSFSVELSLEAANIEEAESRLGFKLGTLTHVRPGIVRRLTTTTAKQGEASASECEANRKASAAERIALSPVETVCARYNLTLPKSKWPWRAFDPGIQGTVTGLPTLTGTLVLSNGLTAIMIPNKGGWADIHFGWFEPANADDSTLAEYRADLAAQGIKTTRPSPSQSRLRKALEAYD